MVPSPAPGPVDDPHLDNWVWHSLAGPHAAMAERHRGAARYPSEVSPFSALDDPAGPETWTDLAELIGQGGQTVLFRTDISPPAGWTTTWAAEARQMVLPSPASLVGSPAAIDGITVRVLEPGDVDAMLDLTSRTRPGPFLRRTAELGTYLGAHHGSELVAMAGERCRLPGWTEVSAVCTDPAHRGRGLAADLVRRVALRIFASGERPLLHAAADNGGAIGVYERLGFVHRRPVWVAGLRSPGPWSSGSRSP